MSIDLRRSGTSVVLALLLAACGGEPQPRAAGEGAPAAGDAEKVVHVYNWSDYIDQSVIADFERETGIDVVYDVFDSNEVLETKLLTGSTGYDVVVPSASFLERQIKAGVFQPLDKSKLPNLKNLDPELVKRVALHDPGNEHAVLYMWGTSGIGYDADAISKHMPDAPLESWRMFFDPAVVAKFADCGVSVLDAPSEVVGDVLIHLGRDANSETDADLKAAEELLAKIRPSVRYVNSQRYIEDLVNGEICLALGWSGDVLQARDRAVEAGKGRTIRYAIPKEGTVMFFDMLAIPKDAPHPHNAHLFIDFLLRPDIAARNSKAVRYATGNVEVPAEPGVEPPPELRERLVPDLAESPEFTRRLTRAWTRFKTGR